MSDGGGGLGGGLHGSSVGLPKRRRGRVEPRHIIVLACFLATLVMYMERVGFSIAFTELAKSAELDESMKGTVLSAFFWGYALSQVPGGAAAQRYGGRVMLLLSFALWSTVSVVTPTDARHAWVIVFARVAIGVAQGFLIPSVHTVLSQWIPPHERAKAVSLATSGMYLGSAAAMWVLPSVAATFGASSLLLVDGGVGYAWLAMWMAVGREIPHRETVIPLSNHDSSAKTAATKGRPGATPWGRMMASPAVWAIVISNFSFHYSVYVVMNWLPTYFSSLLQVELHSLGMMKTLPYVTMFVMSNVGGWAGDWFIHRLKMSVASGRKLVNTLGFIGAACCLMLMPAAGGVLPGIAATTLSLGALGFSRGGFSVNHMDIAPKYAGVVMGISNTAGTLSGVIGVAVTGVILDWGGGAAAIGGWYAAHAAAAALLLFAMVVFNVFAQGERLFDVEH